MHVGFLGRSCGSGLELGDGFRIAAQTVQRFAHQLVGRRGVGLFAQQPLEFQ